MFEYVRGVITVLSPAHCVIDVGGVGYLLNISLTTYSDLKESEEKKLFGSCAFLYIARTINSFLGFSTEDERTLFRHLISVSGVGANTARMMLSSMPPNQLLEPIVNEEVAALKSIKGIGQRSAERIVVDLKDKVKIGDQSGEIFTHQDNTTNEEALSALVMLGFAKKRSKKWYWVNY
jgi:Holliday junction DNA helicase RuvA